MLHTPYLIVNSGKVAFDLLNDRAKKYSDRPYSVMATELYVIVNLVLGALLTAVDSRIGWDFISTTMRHGATWRLHRKMLHQYLGPQNANNYRKVMVEEIEKYLRSLVSKPGSFLDATKQWESIPRAFELHL